MSDALHDQICRGGYWLKPPAPGAGLAIVYTGAIAPEAQEAHEALLDDVPGAGLLAITSDRLHDDWMHARHQREQGIPARAHIEELLGPLDPRAALVTVSRRPPGNSPWIGSVGRQRVAPLGVESYGQSGDIPDLLYGRGYRRRFHHRRRRIRLLGSIVGTRLAVRLVVVRLKHETSGPRCEWPVRDATRPHRISWRFIDLAALPFMLRPTTRSPW